MCCSRLAKYRTQKIDKNSPSAQHRTTLCRAVSSQLRHVSTTGKNVLSSNISPTCPHNMVNYGPLAAHIDLPVWDIPVNFNGFRVSASGDQKPQFWANFDFGGSCSCTDPLLPMAVKFGVLQQTQGLHLHEKFHLNAFTVSASGGQKPQFGANFEILRGTCQPPVPTPFYQ